MSLVVQALAMSIAAIGTGAATVSVMNTDIPDMARRTLRHRYVALALVVNMPGNSVIGGGGGIMMLAGLSGIFAPVQTFVTIAVAVSPVPLAILLLGA